MDEHSDTDSSLDSLREKIIGLGERSIRKSYYPELQQKLGELQRFRALLDQSNDMVFLLQVPSAGIIDVNESACRQLRYTRDALLACSLYDISDEKTLAPLKLLFKDGQAGVLDSETFDALLCGSDNSLVPVEIAVKLVAFAGALYAVASVRDISERRSAEAALRESEEKYRTLFEESRDAIFMSTPEGKYLDINPAGVELLGYSSKEEMLSVDIDKDIYVDPADRARFKALLDSNGFVKDYEIEMKRKDGKKMTFLSTVTAVRNEAGEIIAYRGIRRDITEHKRLEQELRQAQKMEAVGQLAGGIAHDFNNILTAIMGYGSLLHMKLSSDSPLRAYIAQILESAGKAAEVTHSLLAFSRKQIMNPRAVDINEIIRRVERLLTRLIGEDIEIYTELADEPVCCMADSGQIEQVLMNLATNARDAMPSGGKLHIRTQLVKGDGALNGPAGFGKSGTYVLISVSDTGMGMTKETVEKIFEPFFTTKETGKGTGLGLAMAYGIIRQHDGYIDVNSEPGKGTTFNIYLPATSAHEDVCAWAATENPPRGGAETILVAEDDEKLRNLFKIVLSQRGYEVLLARDGEKAISMYMKNRDRIGLVIVDLVMPKKSGGEVYDEIKKINPYVKVLFCSGYTADFIGRGGIPADNINLITKPVAPNILLEKVRDILDGSDENLARFSEQNT
ncbi:MAG TPA: PAS domain S-box protein [Dissulfurispiraceae bacterium]|nr:PAS domain S-box protein [Dissulfurispiraceae bacterium]